MPGSVDADALIPGRHEDKSYLLLRIAAGQLRIVSSSGDSA